MVNLVHIMAEHSNILILLGSEPASSLGTIFTYAMGRKGPLIGQRSLAQPVTAYRPIGAAAATCVTL